MTCCTGGNRDAGGGEGLRGGHAAVDPIGDRLRGGARPVGRALQHQGGADRLTDLGERRRRGRGHRADADQRITLVGLDRLDHRLGILGLDLERLGEQGLHLGRQDEGLAEALPGRGDRRGRDEIELLGARDLVDILVVRDPVLDPGDERGEGIGALALLDRGGDLGADRFQRPGRSRLDRLDADDLEGALGCERSDHRALRGVGGEGGLRRLGAGLAGESLLGLIGEGQVARRETGARGDLIEARAGAQLLRGGVGGGAIGQHDPLQRARLTGAILGGVLAVIGLDFLLGRLAGRRDLFRPHHREAHHAPFRNLEARAVLRVETGDLGVGRIDRRGERARRNHADRAAPPLEQQIGEGAGDAFRHALAERDRAEQLALEQRAGDILAQLRLGEVLVAQRGAEGIVVELAGEIAELRDVDDLAIDHPLASRPALARRRTAAPPRRRSASSGSGRTRPRPGRRSCRAPDSAAAPG